MTTPPCPDGECAPHEGRGHSAVFAALLCAHCSLTVVIAVAGVFFASLPTLFGIPLNWIAPPFFILGLFALWLWNGRRASERPKEAAQP